MKNLLVIILLLVTVRTYCQKKNQFSFAIGSAIPLGNFQETDLSDVNSGYAENGRSISISYSRSLLKQISLRLTLMSFSNKMDSQPELQAYINASSTSRFVSTQNRAWGNTSLLRGVSKEIKFSDRRFSFEPILNAGYSYTTRPYLYISNHTDDNYTPQSEIGSEASSLSIQLSVSNNYSINDAISIFIAFEYFATSPSFDFIRFSSTDMNSSSVRNEISYTQDIRLFMINGGLRCFF